MIKTLDDLTKAIEKRVPKERMTQGLKESVLWFAAMQIGYDMAMTNDAEDWGQVH